MYFFFLDFEFFFPHSVEGYEFMLTRIYEQI